MAFKSVKQFNEDRYHGLFRLVNDGDNADVIFLYQKMEDMMVADAHYIKSSDYSGYVHCTGKGCPACAKGIRVQNKLFIPMYVVKQNGEDVGEIQFWDRNIKFEPQIEKDVFANFPDPSEYIFKITRKGAANDIDTKYEIKGTFRNTLIQYDAILAKCQTKMPDCYSVIIKDAPPYELEAMLKNSGGADMPDYTPVPRVGYQSSIPETFVDAAEAVGTPADTPVTAPTTASVELPDLPDASEIEASEGSDGSEVVTDLPDPIF